MDDLFLRVKGIIKKGDKYLILKRWMDDRIPDPFIWEFIDGKVEHNESPDEAVLRYIYDSLGVYGQIERIIYTWNQILGDTQCVGIAYLCTIEEETTQFELPEEFGGYEWIKREEFEDYIENSYVLQDLKGVSL